MKVHTPLLAAICLAASSCHDCPDRCPALRVQTRTSPAAGGETYQRDNEPPSTECYAAYLDHEATIRDDKVVDLHAIAHVSCAAFELTIPLGDPRSWSAAESLQIPVDAWLAYTSSGDISGPPDQRGQVCTLSLPVTAKVEVHEASGGASDTGVSADYHRSFRLSVQFETPGEPDGTCPSLTATIDHELASDAQDFSYLPNDPCQCPG